MFFNRNKKRLRHFMMRPVFFMVLVFGVDSVVSAKTLVFQSQPEPAPGQLLVSNSAESVPAPKVYKTQAPKASANSELFFMLEQLQQEVRYLRGMLEEQGNQIHRLKLDGKNRYRDLDSRVLDLSKRLSSASSVPSASVIGSSLSTPVVSVSGSPVVSEAASVGSSGVAKKPQAKAASAPLPSDAQKREYQQAYGLIKEKRFDEAINSLHLFIEHYPEGELAGNAYYWLGEVYLVLPQLEQAKQAFSVVVSAFPQHRKAPDALFKLGVSYDRLQDPAKSEQFLNEVQLKFPESTAAKLAKSYKINR